MDPLIIGKFIGGVVALIVGARFLVQGAAKLAVTAGIAPVVVGLTVVAFGTGSPELAVTGKAALDGVPDLALGNVVGSNIANILLVVGVSSLITPLAVKGRLVRWDVPLMIVVSILLLVLGWDRELDRLDGAIMTGGIVLYTIIAIASGRRARSDAQASVEESVDEVPSKPAEGFPQVMLQLVLMVGGLALLVAGAHYLVQASTTIARAFGVSELIIGLTIVAVGTSLPEGATSVIAGLRGQREIALGNAVGSNIFNILAVLGLAALVAPGGVPVSVGALGFDIPVMIAVAVACLPVVFTGGRIARWEGGLFLLYYIAYLVYLFLQATEHSQRDEFRVVMLVFVIPLTVIGLGLTVIRAIRTGQTTRKLQRQS